MSDLKNNLIRSSGRAIANAGGLVAVKLVDDYVFSKEKPKMKEIAIDAAVLGVATLATGSVNSFVTKFVALPAWLVSIEASYGVDLINILIYVLSIKLIDMKMGHSRSMLKVFLEALSAMVLGQYIVGPINNLLPISK